MKPRNKPRRFKLHRGRQRHRVAVALLRERAALIPPPSDDEPFALGFNAAIEVLEVTADAS